MRPAVFDGRDAINFMENLGEIGLGGKSGRPGDIGYREVRIPKELAGCL